MGAQAATSPCCPKPPHADLFLKAEWVALSSPADAFLMQIGSDKLLYSPDPCMSRNKPKAA